MGVLPPPAPAAEAEAAVVPAVSPPRPDLLGEWGLLFGLAYDSAAVIPDGTPPPAVAAPVSEYVPTARPGHRAPHLWTVRDGARRSTIDLFGTGFTLLTGPAGTGWCAEATGLARTRGVPLAAHTIGPAGDLHDIDGGVAHDLWRRRGRSGAGPPGWLRGLARAHGPADPHDALATALGRVLGDA